MIVFDEGRECVALNNLKSVGPPPYVRVGLQRG